jgi:hypothetical protein
MASRRDFLHHGLRLSALGLVAVPLADAAARTGTHSPSGAVQSSNSTEMQPPPDLFDAQVVDMDFWVKPRTLSLVRPQSGERTNVLYWKDGEVIDSAYQELCHILRDVNGKASIPIDPKLLETLWASQAFVARYGLEHPLEILSGYRTPASNEHLREQGVPRPHRRLDRRRARRPGAEFSQGRRRLLFPLRPERRLDPHRYWPEPHLERLSLFFLNG